MDRLCNATESILDSGNISADLIDNTIKVFTSDNSIYCENGVFTYNIINSKGDLVASAGSSDIDYKYNAYGEKLESSNDNNPIGYRNYYYDTETGLYYLKARYYDPTTGQFTQEDTVHDDNLQYNLYGYCSGNPILYVDPSGKTTQALSDWAATMWWLTAIDGPFPVGDAIYYGVLAGIGAYEVVKIGTNIYYTHRSLKNGSKKRLNDKHTKPRPGRNSERKKQKPGWKNRNNKKKK